MSDAVKVQRILSHAEPVTESGCLIWMGTADEWGYGRTSYKGKNRKTTRVLWELCRGEIPAGLCVCHRCDVPACINLDHLFLATRSENMKDARDKGRLSICDPIVNKAMHAMQVRLRLNQPCQRGHLLTPDNIYIRKGGWLQCKFCTVLRDRNRPKGRKR